MLNDINYDYALYWYVLHVVHRSASAGITQPGVVLSSRDTEECGTS